MSEPHDKGRYYAVMAVAALFVSILALLVAISTAVLTFFWRGKLRMTQPVMIGFLFELPGGEPKIFLRTLLYATGKRGHIIEALYLKVRQGESSHTFSFWMYGETKDLKIGSGLRAGEEGIAFNHHFLPPKSDSPFSFLAGDYTIEVYARIVNEAPKLLSTAKVTLSPEHANALRDFANGVLFKWGPESQRYRAEVLHPPADLCKPVAPIPYYQQGSRSSQEGTRS